MTIHAIFWIFYQYSLIAPFDLSFIQKVQKKAPLETYFRNERSKKSIWPSHRVIETKNGNVVVNSYWEIIYVGHALTNISKLSILVLWRFVELTLQLYPKYLTFEFYVSSVKPNNMDF
jgi:hypothetical protein